MTLVAAFTAFEVPILVGDLLITRNLKRIGAKKKLHVLSSNCAVGWTGYLESAEVILGKLFGGINSNDCKLDDIEKLLTSVSSNDFRGSAVKLIGWIVEDGNAKCFSWNSDYPSFISFPESAFAGTAGSLMAQMAGGHKIIDPTTPNVMDKTRAIASVTNFTNRLMADEMLQLLDPELAFGESFEILVFDTEGGFQYLDNNIYLIMDVIIDKNCKVVEYRHTGPIYKVRAFGNYCLSEKYYPVIKHTDFNLIFPVGYTDEQLENEIMSWANPNEYMFSLDATYYCLLVRFIEAPDSLFEFMAVTLRNDSPNVKVVDGVLQFEIPYQELLDMIIEDRLMDSKL